MSPICLNVRNLHSREIRRSSRIRHHKHESSLRQSLILMVTPFTIWTWCGVRLSVIADPLTDLLPMRVRTAPRRVRTVTISVAEMVRGIGTLRVHVDVDDAHCGRRELIWADRDSRALRLSASRMEGPGERVRRPLSLRWFEGGRLRPRQWDSDKPGPV